MDDSHIIPSWLDKNYELIGTAKKPAGWDQLTNRQRTVLMLMTSLKALLHIFENRNLNKKTQRILEILSNSIVETGWFLHFSGYNFGGWKIYQGFAEDYLKVHKVPSPWYRADGHINLGDPEICYYRGFNSLEEFYQEWVEKFVPETASLKARYFKTGQAFWQGLTDWLYEICVSGYKGPVTQKDPDASVAELHYGATGAQKRIAQYILGVEVDGSWGKKSTSACMEFQKAHGLPVTGNALDMITFEKLIEVWKTNGFVIDVSKV